MNKNFAGRVALVTGSTRGLGLEVALRLAKRECIVYVNGREGSEVDKSVNKIRSISSNENVFPASGDLSIVGDVSRMVNDIYERHGRIDFLVNNAGIYLSKRFLDSDYDEIMHPISVNLLGHIHLALLTAKLMSKGGFGRIVNVSSGSGIHGGTLPSFGYSLSKNGLNFMTEILARELDEHGIRINTVVVSFMDTEILKVYRASYYEMTGKRQVGGKMLDVGRVASKIVSLLNPEDYKPNGRIINMGVRQ